MKYKFIIPSVLFSIAATALADNGTSYNLLQPLPNLQSLSGTNPFGSYMAGFIPFILSLAALLAVVMIVWGGIRYAVSEAVDDKSDAKDRITQAILGLLLAMLSYLILWTINPALLNMNLSIPDLNINLTAPTTPLSVIQNAPECTGPSDTHCSSGTTCTISRDATRPTVLFTCQTSNTNNNAVVPPPNNPQPTATQPKLYQYRCGPLGNIWGSQNKSDAENLCNQNCDSLFVSCTEYFAPIQ